MGLLLVGMAALSAAKDAGAAGARDPVAQIIDQLRERHAPIKGLSCTFRLFQKPTPYYVARVAREENAPAETVAKNYGGDTACRFVETAGGQFYLQVTQLDADGKPTRRDLTVNDGKLAWTQIELPPDGDKSAGEFIDSQTQIGGAIAVIYEGTTYPRHLLGDTVLPSSKPIHVQLTEARDVEQLDEASVGGAPCVVLRWRATVNGAEMRTTLWLDKARNLMMRRSLDDYHDPEKGWVKSMTCEVHEVGVTRYEAAPGSTREYHYPKVFSSELFNSDLEKTFDYRYEIDELQINPRPPAGLFALRIDEGTGVLNLETHKYSVYGHGPGPKLKALIDRRVEEAKQQAQESGGQGPPGVQAAPTSPIGHGVWIALIVGVVGLIVALVLRIRARAS
jgi:hypothetical protein